VVCVKMEKDRTNWNCSRLNGERFLGTLYRIPIRVFSSERGWEVMGGKRSDVGSDAKSTRTLRDVSSVSKERILPPPRDGISDD